MHISVRVSSGLTALALVASASDLTGAAAAPAKAARAAGGFELTVDSIMRGPKLVGYPPTGLRWSGDSSRLYFEWRKAGDDDASTWVVGRDGGQPRKLTDEERRTAPPANGRWDKAHRRVLFVDRGDIVMLDTVTSARRQITRTTGNEGNPRWARRESAVTFTRDNNLFLVPLDSGEIAQLTDVQARKRDPRETDSQTFVKAEEPKLIEHTRIEQAKKKRAEAKDQALALPKYELADRQTAQDLQLSPDGRHVFLTVLERAEGKRPNVPNYVTESSYTEEIPTRSYVGDTQDRRTLVVIDLETGTSQPADGSFGGKRDLKWNMPQPNESGAVVIGRVRSEDNKDNWLVAIDPETAKTRVVDTLHDEAWVQEPPFGWLDDQQHIWFLSERDGWMQLYTLDATAAQPSARQLTQGKWEVEAVALSADRSKFYLTTSEVHPGERQIYSMPIGGGERIRLTTMAGGSSGEASPDDRTFGLIYSSSTRPNEVYVMPNRPGAAAAQVTTSTSEEWRSFKWAEPQVVTYKTRDGAEVHARLITPEMVGAKRDAAAPAVVFVHGAGYLQNAHKYWSTYYREYMFNNLLASRGYVVLDPDYRASAGYGRDWRTAIYRHMGGKDLEDVNDGAKFLVATQKVNAKRIGVYGGSYGGFITLMAMFTTPDVFAAGAALRPVTDWAHYNHGYTANILNEPQGDAEAYRKSSPIYFAEGLKGALLICHGMVDTNVLFQDSVRLVQRLIELRKDNWSVAPFPVENHGFEEDTSWADEYKRILKLFEDNLKSHDPRRTS